MNIQRLKNPKTNLYLEFKSYVLSSNFPWYWYDKAVPFDLLNEGHHNVPFFSHEFLTRPDAGGSGLKFPKVSSEQAANLSNMFLEILKYNEIDLNCFLRINANCVLPNERVLNTVPHKDHEFPHKNIVIYLTNSGGKIFVDGESHDPEEDDVVVFDGLEHYVQTPKQTEISTRRIVLVATFF